MACKGRCFAVPVGQVEEINASDKGFLGRKEMLELRFAPEANLSGATLRLHLGADNEEWAGLIGRVKSGEIAKERTQPKEEAAHAGDHLRVLRFGAPFVK